MNDMDRQQELNRLLGDLKNGDEPSRRYAAEDLGFGQFREAISGLAHGLIDPSVAVAEACSSALNSIGGDEVARALVVNLASEDVRLRNLSSEVLSKIGNDAVPALASQLESLDRDVRKFAVDSLLSIGSDASMKALVVALDDSDVNVAATAADGLGEIGNQDHLEILATYLGTDDEWMRCAVVRGMTTIGGPKALKLVSSYLNDPSMVVKITCIQGVGKIHVPESASALVELLAKEEPGFFASEVITALHGIIVHLEPEQLVALSFEETAVRLAADLGDSLKPVKLCAIELLGIFGFAESVPALLCCLETPDAELRDQAVRSLSTIKQDNLAPYQAALENADASVECNVSILEAAAAIFGEKSRQLFEISLASEDMGLVAGALRCLPVGLGMSIFDSLVGWIASPLPELRQVCAETMGRIGDEGFVKPLVSQLAIEDDDEVRELIDGSLVQIGSLNPDSGVRPYLQSFSAEERQAALTRYGFEGLKDRQSEMIRDLDDIEPNIRVIAFKVLANLDLLSEDLIKRGLADQDTLVQVEAVRGVSGFSDLSLRLGLIKEQLNQSDSHDERVGVELVAQLVQIGGEVAVSLIRPFLHSESIWVRVEAVEGLKSLGDISVVEELKGLLSGAEDEFLEALEQAIYELE